MRSFPAFSQKVCLSATVQLLFEQSIIQFPDRVAVVDGAQTTTYAELEELTQQLGAALRAHAPAAGLVGVSTARGLDMVVRVLAVLQAGKGYVPLDPAHPAPRLARQVANAQLDCCLAPAGEAALFEGLGLRVLAADGTTAAPPPGTSAAADVPADRPAYVLYTSGSTGEPKGVSMGHAALLNLLHWQRAHSGAGPGTRTLQFAPLGFDVSFQEIFATLGTGGTLVLLTDAQRRDAGALLDFIDNEQINRAFLPFVALQQLAELAGRRRQFPVSLREVMTAGEQLKITPQVAAFFTALPGCVLHNQYGPTECHVVTQLTLTGDPAGWARLPTIGQAIDNVAIHLLTPDLQPVPDGEVGELCIAGAGLADGYLNQPALTAERFITWRPSAGPPVRLYRSGDLARQRPDGNLEFLGRQDEQVKIRGHRVEPGEVEAWLAALPGVAQAAVLARELAAGDGCPELVAYVVPAGPDADAASPDALRRAAAAGLPDYLRPAAFVVLPEFPKTSSGKVDRRALPAPATQRRASLGTSYHAPRTAPERHLAAVWAPLLRLDAVGVEDNFFELGGNSLLAQKAVAQLQAKFGYRLPVTQLYQFPTVAGAARYLAGQIANAPAAASAPAAPAPARDEDRDEDRDIAIIGMAGRFPGAATVEELWDLLREGRETTRFFGPAELDTRLPAALREDPLYVPAKGVIDHVEDFDAAFFGLSPRLAAAMDPQQRVLLELAWEALEQTGHLPAHFAGRVGVFAGVGNNSYYPQHVQGHPAAGPLGEFQVMAVNEKDYAATRVAYALNLRGPAVSVQSACSTGLLAVAQAVQSLRAGQCEVALAGAASIAVPLRGGYLHQAGAMLSPDGHCRPFDAQAQGTVFSDGAGVVLLKPLAAARRAGDAVLAVVRGVGVSNDGGGKGSFAAPSAAGQAAAIGAALADGRVAPATIGYVEAHGTGTPIGDPIELEGLRLAFGAGLAAGSCALGSVKSNFGHLTAAAGVAGLIKAVLALRHRQLPATLHFAEANPLLNLADSPFFVSADRRDWPAPAAGPRRAGVSSFGVGGTNVHVVLEAAAPPEEQARELVAERPVQLVAWSARTAGSAEAYARRLADFLLTHPQYALADVAFSLPTTRAPLAERRFVVAASPAELAAALQRPAAAPAAPVAGTVAQVPGAVVFLFPGQGAQYLHMGRGLYEREAVFRAAVDECARLLGEWLDVDVREVLYPAESAAETAAARLHNTRYAQPALFVTEYALARLWLSWGLVPTALVGHSLGEFVAACLADVFSLADALRLVAGRGRLVSALPGGRMLAVRAPAARVAALLPATLDVAAVNGPRAVVVAGPAAAVAAFAELLAAEGIPSQPLAAGHAFHSALVAPAVAAFEAEVARVPLAPPRLPVVSAVTGTWLTDAQATDPAYWAAQLRAPVQFAAALETVLTEDNPLLLEVGPGRTLATLARQLAAGRPHRALPGLPAPAAGHTDAHALLDTLGRVWLAGVEPDWRAFYAGQRRRRVPLPAYCFDRQRCWLDPPTAAAAGVPKKIWSAQSLPAPETVGAPLPALAPTMPAPAMRPPDLLPQIAAILREAADVDVTAAQADRSFLELGLDSLALTQVALTLRKTFDVPVSFRQLSESLNTPAALAAYLDQRTPAAPSPAVLPSAPVETEEAGTNHALRLITAQLHSLTRQVVALQSADAGAAGAIDLAAASYPAPNGPDLNGQRLNGAAAAAGVAGAADLTPEEAAEDARPFGATARIERQTAAGLTAEQQKFLADFTARYNRKTAASKAYAQQHRPHMADPRVVSGFAPPLKELTYPLVVGRSAGSRLWDLDGNEYVDALNGFGSSLFGHQPAFVQAALHEQVELGYEVGPQHPLAGEVSQLICALTGHDRAALCNTGSEAVLGALRVARTVTGRALVVAFAGAYHGINDETIVRGTRQGTPRPAAPGILPAAVQHMLILEYGTAESLRIIGERGAELAAVLVEPVQSRRPECRPVAFLQQLRRLTAAAGTALIFDEVITGFRMHPGGAQALFGVRADLATYGKVIGGGLPIGALAGRREFMDALDGGAWQYGDASVPEVGVTYFAGTFVRHPLALAAARASLRHLQARGPALQAALNATTEGLAAQLSAEIARRRLPLRVAQFGSLWKIKRADELPYGTLLFTLMRDRGIHIWDNFPCFLTTAHTAEDVARIVAAFAASVDELAAVGLLPAAPPALPPPPAKPHGAGTVLLGSQPAPAGAASAEAAAPAAPPTPNQPPAPGQPPVTGARLGRDAAGNPAWFLRDPERPAHYLTFPVG